MDGLDLSWMGYLPMGLRLMGSTQARRRGWRWLEAVMSLEARGEGEKLGMARGQGPHNSPPQGPQALLQ